MRKDSMLAYAAMAIALASPEAVMAQTQSSTLTVSEQLELAQQQIAQLQAQLNQLQAQVAQQAQVQSQAAAETQAAASKADQAIAKADAAQAQAAKPAPLPDALKWAADTKISGRMYFNVSSVSHEVNGSKTAGGTPLTDNGGGYNIKRFYLGVDHKFNDTFSANLTTDVSAISGTGMTLYIKKAYLQAKIDPALTVRLGAADMPWIPYVENIYGYRHIEQTLSDRTKFGTSSDWGVHVLGDLAGGLFSYQVSAVTGAGYRDVHFGHTVDIEGRVSAKYKGFNAAIGVYTGKLGKNLEGSTPARSYNRVNALLAYQGEINKMPLTVGGEYFWAENKSFNSTGVISTAAPSDSADGYSLFASFSPIKKWSIFGRYDWVKPSRGINPAFKDEYFNVGIQYSPVKIVDLALVYKRDRAVNGAFATGDLQSGVIGCSTGGVITCSGEGTYDEIGLFGQFRF